MSVSFSKVSLAKVTVACADDFIVLVRFDAGMCRFVNHPFPEGDVFASSPIGLTPFSMDTSKLFDRLDFLRLVRRSGRRKLLDFCVGLGCVVEGVGATGVGTSFIRLISVAEEASDESKEMRSVLVQIMPAFLEGVVA